ncbi:MAG: TadE/TadG family type IV pilus assembly protein [Pseudomonadota bacterium]
MRLRGFLNRLRRDERGATVVEFAIVAPVMCMVLLGAFDVAHTLYMRGTLQGIVQKVARDSTLEDSADTTVQNTLDERVKSQVKALANNATITITRRFYRTFSQASAARAETFTDSSSGIYKNGTCDGGEPYEDANRNGTWDKDGGNAGQGGAKDATLYTVTVTYPRFFPIYKFIGGSQTTKLTGSTVLKNQPYGDQAVYAAMQVRNCT